MLVLISMYTEARGTESLQWRQSHIVGSGRNRVKLFFGGGGPYPKLFENDLTIVYQTTSGASVYKVFYVKF